MQFGASCAGAALGCCFGVLLEVVSGVWCTFYLKKKEKKKHPWNGMGLERERHWLASVGIEGILAWPLVLEVLSQAEALQLASAAARNAALASARWAAALQLLEAASARRMADTCPAN